MRLAPRLALSFGLLTVLSTSALGVAVRQGFAAKETSRFVREVEGACVRAVSEVKRQAEADRALVAASCQEGELADRLGIALDAGELDVRGTGLSQLVPRHRAAFDLDELVLAAEGARFLAASPTSLLGATRRESDASLTAPVRAFELRKGKTPALVARCTKRSERGTLVGVTGARHLGPLLERLGKTLDVRVLPEGAKAAPAGRVARAACALEDEAKTQVRFEVLKPTTELEEKLADIDRSILAALAFSLLVALALAALLARGLGRPLAELAAEVAKVAGGEARPIAVRGSGEVAELARAFDRMIEDLAVTRRRLAAASRIAAWREVARRVAHEIKNPLAPIRAAVETLRRLRAREDSRFDDYFDEATRTVLDEVHRISSIVTEFTRFARLPAPRPQPVDPEEVAKQVVRAHEATTDVRLAHVTRRRGELRADRDQVVQVLTNLVQNALDAVKGRQDASVTVTTDAGPDEVTFTVADDGPGVSPEIAGRLFEPYATDKVNGTGLGLAIAQRIAVEHGGDLAYLGTSASGRGAVFRMTLPVSGPAAPADDPPSST